MCGKERFSPRTELVNLGHGVPEVLSYHSVRLHHERAMNDPRDTDVIIWWLC